MTKPVAVNIQNLEEPGTVTLSAVQPQAGTFLTATLEDDDQPTGITWQWYRTSSRGSAGTAITNATSRFYPPVDPEDVGGYLRAVASYDDPHGDDKTAVAVSANRVQARPPDPAPPEFPADGDYERSIRENTRAGTNLGAPITATDINSDRLTYSIDDTANFEIDGNTGQLRNKVELDHETGPSRFVLVTATDPSDFTDTVTVTITVEDVDETPVVSGPASPEVAENGNTDVAAYRTTDPDGEGIEWVLTGSDSGDFTLGDSGLLRTLNFNEVPNYEEKSQYRLTIEGREQGEGTSVGRLNVTVSVTNVDETGVVEVSVSEPRVGQQLTPTVVDPDGGVSSTEWKWESSPDGANWTPIPGATSRSYTPTRHDNGDRLRVTAIYRDGQGPGKTYTLEFTSPVVLRPYFDADTATRSVQENTAADQNVGGRFTAGHPDNVNLTYALRGSDASFFSIDTATGQLKTSASPLDYESLTNHEAEVEIIATAPHSQTAAIAVTITVTDECRTAGEPPCAPSVSSASASSLRVSWSAPSADTHDLRYREEGINAAWTGVSDTGPGRSYNITQLTTGTTYEVQVRTVNGGIAGGAIGTAPNRPPEFSDGATANRSVVEGAGPGTDVGRPVAASVTPMATPSPTPWEDLTRHPSSSRPRAGS